MWRRIFIVAGFATSFDYNAMISFDEGLIRVAGSWLEQKMEEIRKQFVVNERNRKVAVQIDIDTFNKIEDLLENYVLIQKIKESEEDESFDIQSAKIYYKKLLEKE